MDNCMDKKQCEKTEERLFFIITIAGLILMIIYWR